MTKLVVFDLDGVLIDSREANYQAFAAGIEAAGLPRPQADEVICLIGLSAHEMMLRLGCPEDRARELYESVVKPHYLQHLSELAHPVADADATLRRLRADGCRVAACTSGDRQTQEQAMRHIGLWEHLEDMQTPDDSSYRKPQVEYLAELVRRLGHEGPVIHVEDSPVGLAMGLEWGAVTVFADYGYGEPGELQPHHRIGRLSQLPEIVAGV